MAVTDPIADLIIRIKNAGMVRKDSVSVPYSKFKMAVAEKLQEAGYIKNVEKKGKKVKKTIDIVLAYEKDGGHKIHDVKRISKPGRRLYKGAKDVHSVRHGHGSVIFSTPQGVLTDREAKTAGVGGEALFEIW